MFIPTKAASKNGSSASKNKLLDLPVSFIKAHTALDRLSVQHRIVLLEGKTVQRMLCEAAHMIDQPGGAHDDTWERHCLQDFVTHLEKAADIAKDQAEQEQRIVSESPAKGGHAEKDAERYFTLSTALKKLAADCRWEALAEEKAF